MKQTKNVKPKISYEPEADVLTWELSDKNIYSAKELGNVVVHFSRTNVPVLIEFLEASKFLTKANKIVRNEVPPAVRKAMAIA